MKFGSFFRRYVFFSGKVGQAATDFMMSYGWAIIIALIVLVGALNFLDLSTLTIEREVCNFFVLDCEDFLVSHDRIILALSNPNDHEIIVKDIVTDSDALVSPCEIKPKRKRISPGEKSLFLLVDENGNNCFVRDTRNAKDEYYFNVTYSWVPTSYSESYFTAYLLANNPCGSGLCSDMNRMIISSQTTSQTLFGAPSLEPLGSISDHAGDLNLYRAWDVFVDVDDERAYVISNSEAGLSIFNVSQLDNITILGALGDNSTLFLNTPNAFFVNTISGLVYLTSAEGFQILDARDPENISSVGSIKYGTGGLQSISNIADFYFSDGLVYLTTYKGVVQILNVSDPKNIVVLDRISDNSSLLLDDPTSIFVDADRGLAYVTSKREIGIQILNVSDPTNITPLDNINRGELGSVYSIPLWLPFDIFVDADNGLAYVADLHGNGAVIFNVSDPTDIKPLGFINLRDHHSSLVNFVSIFVDTDRGLAYLTSTANIGYSGVKHGVQILNVSDPTDIEPLGFIEDEERLVLFQPKGFFIDTDNELAYVASSGDDGVQVLDVSDPRRIRDSGSIKNKDVFLTSASDIFVDVYRGLAYVTSNIENSVQILDVSDPANIVPLGSTTERNNPDLSLKRPFDIFVDVDRGWAYVTSYGSHGFQIFDVRDPDNLVPLDDIENSHDIYFDSIRYLEGAYKAFVDVDSGLAYIASHTDSGVQILDVVDPTKIRVLGSIKDNSSLVLREPSSIFVDTDKKLAYVTSPSDLGMQVLNVSDPTNITPLNSIISSEDSSVLVRAPSSAFADFDHDLVYIGGWGFQALNVSDPTNITPLDGVTNALFLRWVTSIFVDNDKGLAYTTSLLGGGMQVLNVSDPTNITHLASIDNNEGLSTLLGSFFVDVEGGLMYVADLGYGDVKSGIHILNISFS